jgi:hypothetical protein
MLWLWSTWDIKQLRGPKHENWAVCDPRAAPPAAWGIMALKVVKMGTYHAQMGRSMARFAHQPGPVCLEGGVSRWLVGVVGLGRSCSSAHRRRRVGRFFHSSA